MQRPVKQSDISSLDTEYGDIAALGDLSTDVVDRCHTVEEFDADLRAAGYEPYIINMMLTNCHSGATMHKTTAPAEWV